MAYPAYVREKARELRIERRLSIVEIAERLALPKTTIFFICMYIGEGYKRSRNSVSVGNSDPRVVVLATRWLRTLSRNTLRFSVQYHADQDRRKLAEFWASTLDIETGAVRMRPKRNSGRLGGRVWRCKYGVLAVTTNDTLLRAQLQAWMDCVQEQWVDSPSNGA